MPESPTPMQEIRFSNMQGMCVYASTMFLASVTPYAWCAQPMACGSNTAH